MRASSLLLAIVLTVTSSPILAQATPVPRPDTLYPSKGSPKSATAARLAGVIPGAGHMYAGEVGRGFAVIGGMVGIFAVGAVAFAGDCLGDLGSSMGADDCSSSSAIENITTVAVLGLWGWSIWDAGRAANRYNVRHGHPISAMVVPAVDRLVSGGPRVGVNIGVRVALP